MATMSSNEVTPSVRSVCVWRSPRSCRSWITSGSSPARAASISPRSSRRVGSMEGRPRRSIDLALALRGQELARRRLVESVLVQLQAQADRHLPDPDVVRFGPREVDHRRAPRVRRDHAKVHLQPAIRDHRGLGVAACEDPGHQREAREAIHDGTRVGPCHQQIDVADGLRHPAQRPRVRRASDLREVDQVLEERLRDLHRDPDLHPSTRGAQLPESAGDVLLRLGPEPLEARDPVILDGRRQVVDGGDPHLFIQDHRLLRAEARDERHGPDAVGDLRSEILEFRDGAGREVGVDLGPDRLAHPGDLQDRLEVHPREVGRVAAHGTRRLLVGAGFERVAAEDREEIRVLRQHLFDVVVGARHRVA